MEKLAIIGRPWGPTILRRLNPVNWGWDHWGGFNFNWGSLLPKKVLTNQGGLGVVPPRLRIGPLFGDFQKEDLGRGIGFKERNLRKIGWEAGGFGNSWAKGKTGGVQGQLLNLHLGKIFQQIGNWVGLANS